MKSLFFSIILPFFLPATAFAAVDCTANPNAYSCTCYGTIGGVYAEDGSYEDNSATSDAECFDNCAVLNADSYQFEECSGTGEVDTQGEMPIESAETAPAPEASTSVTRADPVIPILNVPIPGLDFTGAIQEDVATGTVTSNLLGLYIEAAYRFLIIAMSIIAVVMIMIGGLEYVVSAGNAKRVERAKTRIRNAIVGLLLLFLAYDIAFLLSPRTVTFESLSIPGVHGIYLLPPEGEDLDVTPNAGLTGLTVPISGTHILNYTDNEIALDPDAGAALLEAADAFFLQTGKNIAVTSADRDLNKQATLFYNNCLRTGICSPPTCNPASSSVVTSVNGRYTLTGELAGETDPNVIIPGLVSHAAYGNCPHTSQVAFDAWCQDLSGFTVDIDCQTTLIQTLISFGFCRLTAEVWHFELDSKKVSTTNCKISNTTTAYTTRGVTYTPPATCQRWDFKNHLCVTQKIP